MPRPRKNTVDYFPHDAYQKSTIRILKSKWQSLGYAFWFQLLEQLATTENHFIDLNPPGKLEDLSALIGCDDITTVEILDQLAYLQTITPELWENKIIWCQNFVNGISDVYKNRKTQIPQKPITMSSYPVSRRDNYEQKPRANGITTPDNPQSKVKESIVKESKGLKPFVHTPESTECERLSNLLFQKIVDRNPNHKIPNFKIWCGDIQKMIKIDKRKPQEIEMVIEWCQADEFWQNNILSISKLRKQYDRLFLKMNSNGNNSKTASERRYEANMATGQKMLRQAQEEKQNGGQRNDKQITDDAFGSIPRKKNQ